MGSTHVLGTRRHGQHLKEGDIVVVERAKRGVSPVLIKLTKRVGVNALSWPVWQFSVVVGIPSFTEYAVSPLSDVELCLPLIEVEVQRPEEWPAQLPFVFRPYHVYVEESEGSSVYNIYKFSRRALAVSVTDCAKKLGLQSFILSIVDDAS